tara:strand:+ start:184 stop:1485 length:1302 start_codon:yes stop_codon:yes gene_type:complete
MNLIISKYTSLSVIKDSIIIFFIYNNQYNTIFQSNPNKLIIIFLIIYWILLNYILGQYDQLYKSLHKKISSNIFNTSIISLSANIIYLYINLFGEKLDINIFMIFTFINIILKIFFLIILSQTIIDIFTIKNNLRRDWLVISNKKTFDILYMLNRNLKNFYNLKKYNKSDNSIDRNICGLIIEKDFILSDNDITYIKRIKKNNLPILKPLYWCEKYLQSSPSELQENNELHYINDLNSSYDMRRKIKRIGDLSLSFFLLISLLPILLVIIIFLYIFQGPPIFYTQLRNGLNEKTFKIIKFRTMKNDAEINGPQWSRKNDERITFCGKLLRKFRLDELPQLLNVINGEMSLIGPRPERPEFDINLNQKIKNYSYRYLTKPGLSGWAQVNYRYSNNINESQNKYSYDLFYIKNQSLLIDFIILFKTIKIIFKAKG